MACHPPHSPVIAIVGTTGTGKSQLAVDLALKYNGEIINADAVQMYDGLPIITNKIPLAERKGVTHHLLGCIGLDEQSWRVDKFVRKAGQVVAEIRRRRKLPIIVGGTHYYTQSLLFHDSLAVEDGEEPPSPKHDQAPNTEGHERHIDDQYPVLQAPTQDMLEKLREVDPIMAARWHPNDRRKIRRSLEIYYKTGRRASELYGEQQVRKQGTNGAGANLEEGSPVDGYTSQGGLEGPATGLRYPTLFLWMHTPRDMLKDRIRSRVDKMIDEGLFDEAACLRRFAAESEEAGQAIDFSRGVFISIGYKECLPYLSALHDPEAEDKTLVRLREEAVEKTKTATWQYAKYQERWIRIKLLRAIKQAGAEEYLQVLNIGRPEDWDTEVSGPAVDAVRAFLDGDSNRLQSTETSAVHEALTALEKIDAHGGAMPQAQTCELCNVTATTTQEWSKHVNSNRHRKTVKAKQKRSHMLLETVP